MNAKISKLILPGIIVLLVLIFVSQSFVIIPAGHSGVVMNFGEVQDRVLTEGIHFKMPLVQSIVEINNQTKKVESNGSASSKDLQIITYVIALNYKIDNLSSAKLYQSVGPAYESIVITPAIQEVIKAVTARFTAEELITRRQEVSEQIKVVMSDKITPYGLIAQTFNIVNFEFSEEFNKAVEAKQTAQQQALKAEQDLQRIRVEAEQKVEQARAEAESISLIQNMLATAPQYIEYIKWSNWDGALPAVMGTSDLMLDVNSLIE